jgi:hypothetical protein
VLLCTLATFADGVPAPRSFVLSAFVKIRVHPSDGRVTKAFAAVRPTVMTTHSSPQRGHLHLRFILIRRSNDAALIASHGACIPNLIVGSDEA